MIAEDGAEVEVSNDPELRPEAIRQAAGIVTDLYAIDVTLDGVRDTLPAGLVGKVRSHIKSPRRGSWL